MPSTCTSTGTNIVDKTLTYDALGNISTKSDVGTYGYTGAGPHAVTSVTGSYLGLTNPAIGYDLNGNMTCVSTASSCGGTVARTATYTSFNMAQSVTAGSNTLCLTYNSEHQRITQVQTTATCASPGSGAVTTTYLNDPVSGAMEEAVLSGGVTTRRDYIQADGHIVAERMVGTVGTPTNWNAANWGSFQWAGSVSVLYFTLDHLGSIAVITDTTGAIVERDSYDSWGRQRNPNGTDNAACSISSLTTRGYTNQEESAPSISTQGFTIRLLRG